MTVYRKSWILYVVPILKIMASCGMLLAWWNYRTSGFVASRLEYEYIRWIDLGILFILSIYVTYTIYNIFLLASVKITLTDKAVAFREGILPWAIQGRNWESWQLFQSLASTGKIFDWLIRKADVFIADKEGTTEHFVIKGIGNGRRCSAEINSIIKNSNLRNLARVR